MCNPNPLRIGTPIIFERNGNPAIPLISEFDGTPIIMEGGVVLVENPDSEFNNSPIVCEDSTVNVYDVVVNAYIYEVKGKNCQVIFKYLTKPGTSVVVDEKILTIA